MLMLSLLSVTMAVTPAEALGVQSLMELAANQAAQNASKKKEAVPTGLLFAAMAQAEALIERDGIPLDGAAQEWLRERMMKRLEQELAVLPPAAGRSRREAWERLVRAVTTPVLAQEVLDAALEIPPLTMPETEPVVGTWAQATQLEGSDSFTLERLAVLDEVGSQVNELIDPGEWVELEVTFLNATKLPWFSTSAFVKASGCLWVDEKRGSVVGEMNPGGRASVTLWAFVAEKCTEPSTLRLALSDTHRGSPVGAIVVAVTPTSFARPHATRARLDIDALGSSDGSRGSVVSPGVRFEFIADVRVPGELVSAVSSQWAVPVPARALFKSLSFRGTPSVAQGGGLFAAGDDLDAETVDEDTWKELAGTRSLERWMLTPASPRIWLAMDTTVVLSEAEPKQAISAAATPVPRKGARSPTSMGVSPVKAQPPLAATVAELVKQYVELEPHSVAREKPDAVEAVSGYELLFNRTGFMKAYDALMTPAVTVGAPVVSPAARYVTRSYFALPAVELKPAAAAPSREAPEGEVRPRPPPVSQPVVVEALRRTWLQLDLGGGVTILGTRPAAGQPGLWGGSDVVPFPTLSAHAFIGPHVVGVLGFDYAAASFRGDSALLTFTKVSGDIGAGYRFQWERASLTPYAALLLQLRTHTLFLDSPSIGGLVGLNARLVVASWFGLSLDLAVPISPGGPYAFDSNRNVISIASGIGLRTLLSISLAF